MAMPGPLEMIESVRRHHDAYERGDWDAALEPLSPDVEYVMLDSAPLTGTYRGRDGMAGAMGDWLRAWERGSIRFAADQIIVFGTTVVARCMQQARGRASGAEVRLAVTQVFEFAEDGRARRFVTGADEAAVLAAAGVALPPDVVTLLDAEAGRAAGDVRRALALFADDARFHGDDRGSLAGPWIGPEGVRSFFAEWLSVFEAHESRVELVIDCGDRVVAQATQRGRSRAAGVEVEMVNRGSWWFRDGKVVLVRFFESLEAALGHEEGPLP